jgi:hypothetical protein
MKLIKKHIFECTMCMRGTRSDKVYPVCNDCRIVLKQRIKRIKAEAKQ